MEEILTVNNLSKIYGSKEQAFSALLQVSFTMMKGEFIAIMGPSGAGKSTLLNILATIDSATEGNVLIQNQNLQEMNDAQLADFRRDHLGFIFQDYNLLDSLTVKENILLPLAIKKLSTEEINVKVKAIASFFKIDHILNHYPYQISGGQKQRCAAARALITKPTLLFADEPTGALDSKSSTDLLTSLKQLNELDDASIMMVTHDAFAASFAKRILFINDGQLVKELFRGEETRGQFMERIYAQLVEVGGEQNDVV